MFGSILIANRGEIACRIIRTSKRLGLRTIAVYSEADAGALHVRQADEAHPIGPAPARQSYLDIGRIIATARRTSAECIHPGYGFLSENPDLADACVDAGIVFVGPSAKAIRAMGHKDAAKGLMRKAGVPVVPGYQGADQRDASLAEAAGKIGYPVMIKAVAGGGGKGMRRVDTEDGFADALAACRREAAAAFGDERVLIEKFIAAPRHIEVQILADQHGRCIHLYERDCSLQRRHQKVIEEAPAPKLPKAIRGKMCDAAVAAAKAVGYVNAGTVEFIAGTNKDGEAVDFYFMEMNTRLQVEHPVTEAILGVDLVELQLRVSAGEHLPLAQSDVVPKGHAFEARIYAENPATGFLPQTGTVRAITWPSKGSAIRIDTGIETGQEITPYYDPMIAKLIVHGDTRKAALETLGDALANTLVLGLANNIAFLGRIAADPQFAEGGVTTGFIDAHLDRLVGEDQSSGMNAALHCWVERQAVGERSGSPWTSSGGWSLAGTPRKELNSLIVNGRPVSVEVIYHQGERLYSLGNDGAPLAHGGEKPVQASFFDDATETLFVVAGGLHYAIHAEDLLARASEAGEGASIIRAPMPGRVIRIAVEEGQKVSPGAPLIVMEAMKMEHTLKAGLNGTVKRLPVSLGAQVKEGDALCVLESASP